MILLSYPKVWKSAGSHSVCRLNPHSLAQMFLENTEIPQLGTVDSRNFPLCNVGMLKQTFPGPKKRL